MPNKCWFFFCLFPFHSPSSLPFNLKKESNRLTSLRIVWATAWFVTKLKVFLHITTKSTFLSLNRIKEDHVIQHGLVVDGTSLSLALREHEKLFMEVCKSCSAVLCCRMAPLQKAKVSMDIVSIVL